MKILMRVLSLTLVLLYSFTAYAVVKVNEDPTADVTTNLSTVEVHFSPNKDNERIVSEFIRGAKRSIDIAAYSLTSQGIGEAIEEKSNQIPLRLLCDKQQWGIKNALCKDLHGKRDIKSGLMHNKFIVRDEECVLTGSFNFTNNAIRTNRENYIILCNNEVAKEYKNEFEKLWKNNT